MNSDDALRRLVEAAEMLQLAEAVCRPSVLQHLGAAALADLRSAFKEGRRTILADLVEVSKQLGGLEEPLREERQSTEHSVYSTAGAPQSAAGADWPGCESLKRGLQSGIERRSRRASLRDVLERQTGEAGTSINSSSES